MPSKYGNKKISEDGYTFDSLAEHRRYKELCLLRKAGEIDQLVIHPRWNLDINGCLICTYIADFAYNDKTIGQAIVEDVKGVRTAVYKIKKKLMWAIYKINIVEVKA